MSKRFNIRISRESEMLNEQSDLIEADVPQDTAVDTVEVLEPEAVQAEVDQAIALYEQEKTIEEQEAEIERVEDVSAALEDLAEIVGTIDEISPTDRAMMQTAMNMAVAGTDADATVIVPGMESFVTGALAAEAIKDKVKSLGKAISEMVNNVFDSMVNFYKNIVDEVHKTISQMEKVVSKLNKKNGFASNDIISFNNGSHFVKPDGTGVTDGDEFVKLQTNGFNRIIGAIKNVKSAAILENSVTSFNEKVAKGNYDGLIAEVAKNMKDYSNKLASSMVKETEPSQKFTTYKLNCGIGSGELILNVINGKDYLFTDKSTSEFKAETRPGVTMSVVDFEDLKQTAQEQLGLMKELKKELDALGDSTKAAKRKIKSGGSITGGFATSPFLLTGAGVSATTGGDFIAAESVHRTQVSYYSKVHANLAKLAMNLCKGSVEFISRQAGAYS